MVVKIISCELFSLLNINNCSTSEPKIINLKAFAIKIVITHLNPSVAKQIVLEEQEWLMMEVMGNSPWMSTSLVAFSPMM